MKYINFINKLIRENISQVPRLVIYGQNVTTGSCLSGLTRGIQTSTSGLIINTQNSENCLTGIGYGLMLQGVSSIFFMKQLDFLLLGVDHLVNTYNFLRIKNPCASFTIFPIVVDSGYQGMQSSYNNLADFCSMARIRGYTITNRHDAVSIIKNELVSDGFRIIAVSQRLFQNDIIECNGFHVCEDNHQLFQYTEGDDATIVCFNFSFPYGYDLKQKLLKNSLNCDLFSINIPTQIDWKRVLVSCLKTKKLVIIDDSKSQNSSYVHLLNEAILNCNIEKHILIKRHFSTEWFYPNKDTLLIDYQNILSQLFK